jgi:uncharacterized phiE125 gp8 family phage protein
MGYRPHMRRMVVAVPDGSVVSLAELRAHLRIGADETEFDAELTAIEKAAVAAIERATQRLLIPREVTLFLPGLPTQRGSVELPGGHVSEVSSVEVDGAGVTGSVVYGDSPALLIPAEDWPVVKGEGFPVEIVYTAGYAEVPAALVSAVKMQAEDLFDRPEKMAGEGASGLAHRVKALVDLYRLAPA